MPTFLNFEKKDANISKQDANFQILAYNPALKIGNFESRDSMNIDIDNNMFFSNQQKIIQLRTLV